MSSNESKELLTKKLNIRKLLLLGLATATLLFLIGIFLPMMTLTKFYFAKNSFSIVSGLIELISDRKIVLFIVIGVFSIVFPILKIAVLARMLVAKSLTDIKLKSYLHLMHEYGRWAMLDVMVVAILIVTVKLGAIASIKVHAGLYIFGAAVLLIMFITHYSVKYFDEQAKIHPSKKTIPSQTQNASQE